MITRIRILNFKRFKDIDVELGNTTSPVLLIGPNNSGKSSALQAIALWAEGLKKWSEKKPESRYSGQYLPVAINRKELLSIPVPSALMLWKDLRFSVVVSEQADSDPKIVLAPIRIGIVVEGLSSGKPWSCGLEFQYANEESITCRPLRKTEGKDPDRYEIPAEVYDIRVAYLPPMSGLSEEEAKVETGRINVLIGRGQTAEILRNICFQIYDQDESIWRLVVEHIKSLFGVTLLPPEYIGARGEIRMAYKDEKDIKLDISSSGRGLQQTLLLLAFLYANPGYVLLLDEPDAHLEILRQRQIYELLTKVAEKQNSQIIAASHSEVLLNEAADRGDTVVAFVGKPHRIDGRRSQVRKSLLEIGFDQYYQAEQKGWVIYLEGSTDLAMLHAFAKTINHDACQLLEQPFFKYVQNQPSNAREHFFGLLEAKKDLVGIAIFDRIETLQVNPFLLEVMWNKRELENYLCIKEVLLSYARGENVNGFNIKKNEEAENRIEVMEQCIRELEDASRVQRNPSPWSDDIKASDDFLDPLFENYFEKLNLPNMMRKTNYHKLAELVPAELIDDDIWKKLGLIVEVAKKARPEEE